MGNRPSAAPSSAQQCPAARHPTIDPRPGAAAGSKPTAAREHACSPCVKGLVQPHPAQHVAPLAQRPRDSVPPARGEPGSAAGAAQLPRKQSLLGANRAEHHDHVRRSLHCTPKSCGPSRRRERVAGVARYRARRAHRSPTATTTSTRTTRVSFERPRARNSPSKTRSTLLRRLTLNR